MQKFRLPGGIQSLPLFAHQAVGITRLYNAGVAQGYFGLFDDCGLGKTAQIIYAGRCLLAAGIIDRVIVCCKAGLAENWRREFGVHAPDLLLRVLSGQKPEKRLWGSGDAFIVNFELLAQPPKRSGIRIAHPFTHGMMRLNQDAKNMLLFLQRYRCLLAIDESQRIKCPDSRTTQVLCALAPRAKVRYIATATPEGESPADVWAQMYFLDTGELLGRDFQRHCNRYIVYRRNEIERRDGRTVQVVQPIAFKNLPHLKQKIDSVSIRRNKSVCGDLPDKIYRPLYILTSGREEKKLLYGIRASILQCLDKADSDTIELFGPRTNPTLAGFIQDLLRASAAPTLYNTVVKGGAKIQRLLDILDESNHQLIAWCSHREVVSAVHAHLVRSSIVAAKAVSGNRVQNQRTLDLFASGKVRVLCATIDLLKEGANLQTAHHAVYMQLPWSRVTWKQSQDRIHRIGQTKQVLLDYMLHPLSLDAYQLSLLRAKEQAANYAVNSDGVVVLKTCDFIDALNAW